MHMHIYIYIYICIYVYVYVYIYIHIYIYISVCGYTHTHTSTHIYACMHTHTHICITAHTHSKGFALTHAGEGLPCCPVPSSATSGAANGRAGEEYQVKARYQVRANPLLHMYICIYIRLLAPAAARGRRPPTTRCRYMSTKCRYMSVISSVLRCGLSSPGMFSCRVRTCWGTGVVA